MNRSVDILLASYQGEKYLTEQIKSILNQSHKDLRLIIRDDGSTDQTRGLIESICKQKPSKVILLPDDSNLGIKGNFSALMQHAQADYIMFSDQDDVWYADKVEKTLAKMYEMESEHSQECPILIHTDLTVADSHLEVIDPSFWKHSGLRPRHCSSFHRLLVQNVVTGCTMMINKPLLTLAAPIPQEAVVHDWWIGLVAAAFGKIGRVEQPTMLYRQHHNNAIGVRKNPGWLNLIGMLLRPLQSGLTPYEKQKIDEAKAFYKRYENHLTQEQKTLLKDYVAYPSSSFVKKRQLVLKHGLFSNNPYKNILSLLWDISAIP